MKTLQDRIQAIRDYLARHGRYISGEKYAELQDQLTQLKAELANMKAQEGIQCR